MYLFETMRVEAGDIPRNIYHTKRIANSAEQLNFQFKSPAIFWADNFAPLFSLESMLLRREML